jgi:hypothetical protein
MARIRRPEQALLGAVRLARALAVACIAGTLALALPAFGSLAPESPLPSSVVHAADGGPNLDKPGVPVRVTVPFIGVDLPVVSSERNVKGNPRGYPLCDVAQYWTRYDLPGAPGTAWIYAHAQPGMFLPLFSAAEATDGAGLMGKIIEVQLKDGRLLRYRISEVKQRALNRRIGARDKPSQHRLVLQTSTGPAGTIPKLQVAGDLIGASRTERAAPRPRPRACSGAPRTTAGSGTDGGEDRPFASPGPTTEEGGETQDLVTLVGGSVAVLLGATVLAVVLIRRQP